MSKALCVYLEEERIIISILIDIGGNLQTVDNRNINDLKFEYPNAKVVPLEYALIKLNEWVYNNPSKYYPIVIDDKPRYTKLDNGHVFDNVTKLRWGLSSDKLSYDEAINFCNEQGGVIPSLEELETIVDRSYARPSIDVKIFNSIKDNNNYFTSRYFVSIPDTNYSIDFSYGLVLMTNKKLDKACVIPIIKEKLCTSTQ